jgi:hypothetical protein
MAKACVIALFLLCSVELLAQTPQEVYDEDILKTVQGMRAQQDQSATGQFTFRLGSPHSFISESRTFLPAEDSQPLFAAAQFPPPPQQKTTSSIGHSYFTRRKIHRYASYATLPLLAAEAAVGQQLLNNSGRESESLRSVHSGLAAGIGVLFGAETVTGVWNMYSLRHISKGRNKRLFHGILVLAADVGFIATAATAPHREEHGLRENTNVSAHKGIAYASIGTAAFSYLYMLIAK